VDREGDFGGFFIPFTIHSIKIVQVIIIDLWVKLSASANTPNLGGGAAVFWSAYGLPELWIASERELVGAAGRACSVFPSMRHPKRSQAPALQTWVTGRLYFGVLPACRSFGIASERELVGAAGRACSVFPSVRHPKRSQARKRQHSKLGWRGGCVLECFRLAGALDCVGAGTRGSGQTSYYIRCRIENFPLVGCGWLIYHQTAMQGIDCASGPGSSPRPPPAQLPLLWQRAGGH